MAYRVEIANSARKELAALPKRDLRRVARAIDALAKAPRPAGCVKLSGAQDAYRIRAGDYRIIYRIADRVLTICVVRVGHRRDVYRRK